MRCQLFVSSPFGEERSMVVVDIRARQQRYLTVSVYIYIYIYIYICKV